MGAFKELGIKKTIRYFFYTFAEILLNLSLFPPIKVTMLRMFGAKIGKCSIIEKVEFLNLHSNGFRNLNVGKKCVIAKGVLLDLSSEIRLGDEVIIGPRASIFTHTNVGYSDHPLKKIYPPIAKGVEIGNGSWVAASSTILPGVKIGRLSVVAAGSIVIREVGSNVIVGGVPAREISRIGK